MVAACEEWIGQWGVLAWGRRGHDLKEARAQYRGLN